MTDALQALKVFGVACIVAILGSILSAVVYPAFRRLIAGCDPAIRSLVIVCYGLVSPAVAATVVALVMHPHFSQLLIPGHCHSGACGTHVPVINMSSVGGLVLVAGGPLFLIAVFAAGIPGIRSAHRRLRTLFGIAQTEGNRGFLIVESAELFAWCCGIWRTKILVSSGLLKQLSQAQLQMVLAHERAHERRMDNLRVLALRWLTACWPSALRSRIRADLASDIEQACDLEAAGPIDSRDSYIVVLKKMQRNRSIMASGGRAAAFGCSKTRERIRALVRGPDHYRSITIAVLALLGLCSAEVIAVTGLTHVVVEWLSSLGV